VERDREQEGGKGTEGEKEARALSIGSFVPMDPFFGVALIRRHRGFLEVFMQDESCHILISEFIKNMSSY